MSYATLADLQDFLPKYGITDMTNPSASQAQGYLDRTSSIIDGILAGKGYTVPIGGAESVEILRHLNLLAAGYWITRILFPDARTGLVPELWSEYQTQMMMLRNGELVLPDATTGSANVAISADDLCVPLAWFETHPFVRRGQQF